MERTASRTEKLVVVALMITLQVILTRFVSVQTPFIRISFGYLPIVIAAILYGPAWAAGAYAIGDIAGAVLFPSGPFFPGFTLSAALTGLVYGLFLHRREVTIPRVIISVCIVMLGINLLLNTLWLTILYGKAYTALLPARAVKELIGIPIAVALITLTERLIIRAIRRHLA